mgnify:CR=1 FL=1
MKMHSAPRGPRRLRAAVSASAVVALLAGCGGGGSGESGPAAAGQSPSSELAAQSIGAESANNVATNLAAPKQDSNALTTDVPPPLKEAPDNNDSALDWVSQKFAQLMSRTATADNHV